MTDQLLWALISAGTMVSAILLLFLIAMGMERTEDALKWKKKKKEMDMDTRTGEIMDEGYLRKKMGKDFDRFAKPVNLHQLKTPYRRELEKTGKTKVGPNDPCPCGSGRKFKRCCMSKA